jgi:hypothetical protein
MADQPAPEQQEPLWMTMERSRRRLAELAVPPGQRPLPPFTGQSILHRAAWRAADSAASGRVENVAQG